MIVNRVVIWTFLFSVIIALSFIIYFIFPPSGEMKGEILVMKGSNQNQLIKFNAENNKTETSYVEFDFPQYNPKNSNKLIAVLKRNGNQEIVELIMQNGTYQLNKVLYSNSEIKHPKISPNNTFITFIMNEELYYLNLYTEEIFLISSRIVDYLSYDWLNESELLFTIKEESSGLSHIVKFNLKNKSENIFRKNASSPAMSINKEFLAYKGHGSNHVVYVEELKSDRKTKFEIVTDEQIGLFKPSPDGNYLIANVYHYSQSDIEIINLHTKKRKKILDSIFPSSLDWRN